MNLPFRFFPTKTVTRLKQKAKILTKSSDLTHTQSLEIVAKEFGYDNWNQIAQLNKQSVPFEQMMKNGFVALYDEAIADELPSPLHSLNHLACSIITDDLLEDYAIELAYQESIDNGTPDPESSDWRAKHEEILSETVFVTSDQLQQPTSYNEIIKHLDEHYPLLPELIIYNQEVYVLSE